MTTKEFNAKYEKAEEKLKNGEFDVLTFIEATNQLKKEYSKSLMEREPVGKHETI